MVGGQSVYHLKVWNLFFFSDNIEAIQCVSSHAIDAWDDTLYRLMYILHFCNVGFLKLIS